MPRRRSIRITETASELQSLERKYRGKPQAKRALSLRLLLSLPPHVSIVSIANAVGVSKATLDRWISSYRADGIAALLAIRKSGRTARRGLSQKIQSDLARKYRGGELKSIAAARAWLLAKYGITYSQSGLAQILKATGSAKLNHRKTSLTAKSSAADSDSTLQRLMNSLPQTLDAEATIEALRKALLPLVPDADRITIAIDTSCDLVNPSAYRPTAEIRRVSGTSRAKSDVNTIVPDESGSLAPSVLDGFAAVGRPLDDYHAPTILDLFYQGIVPIGCVMVWRDRRRQRLSSDAFHLIESLKPFLEYVIATTIIRHQQRSPQEQAIDNALSNAANRYRFTSQQRVVLTHQMLGRSYEEIAMKLGVTPGTVRKHLSAVHQKTNTRSTLELFGKLFMPGADEAAVDPV